MLLMTAFLLLQWAPTRNEQPVTDPFYWDHLGGSSQPSVIGEDHGRSRAFYRRMLRTNDADRDGGLDRAEWAAMVAAGYPAASSRRSREDPVNRPFYMRLHEVYDLNRDGEVTLAELMANP